MNKTIHLVDNLTDVTVAAILEDSNCGIVLCSGDANIEEEQKNLVQLNERGITVYTKCDHDTVESVLDEIRKNAKNSSEVKGLVDLEERTKGPNWLGFTDDFSWFGDNEIGFRYTVIDIDLFKRLGLRINGTYAIYIEFAECDMPENIRERIFDMFVDNVCATYDLVHLKDWRYKILDRSDKGNVQCTYGTLYNNNLQWKGPDKSYVFTFTHNLRNI